MEFQNSYFETLSDPEIIIVNVKPVSTELQFYIDDYKVNMSNSHMISIVNRVTLKKINFKIEDVIAVKDKLNLISRQLMLVNKVSKPRYKTIFNNLIEVHAFIGKLKEKIDEYYYNYTSIHSIVK